MASLVVSALGIARIARSIRASNSPPAVRILLFALDVEMASCSARSLGILPAAGSQIVKVVPTLTCVATSITPPNSATMPCTNARPRPVPSPIRLVVKNGSVELGRVAHNLRVDRIESPLETHVSGQ